MAYIKRNAENTVERQSKMFGAVFVSGPARAGKTSMMKKVAGEATYLDLDWLVAGEAKENLSVFFSDHVPPIALDDVQRAPELFLEIKMYIDRTRKKGQFYLCSSHGISAMKGLKESLAGRTGVLTLLGLSLREIYGADFNEPFVPCDEYFDERRKFASAPQFDVWERIHRGCMPELVAAPDISWKDYYTTYVTTYLMRDVEEMPDIKSKSKFMTFLNIVALMNGQALNISNLAERAGISALTVNEWLSVLENCNIVYLMRPYYNNPIKRLTKAPKIYFLDTGLCAYLCGLYTPDSLKNSDMSGAFFEDFVVSEIIKSYYNNGFMYPPIYYYKEYRGKEIDLVIESNGEIHPLEIKSHAYPTQKDIEAFKALDEIPGVKRGHGGVISCYENLLTLDDKDMCIPLSYL